MIYGCSSFPTWTASTNEGRCRSRASLEHPRETNGRRRNAPKIILDLDLVQAVGPGSCNSGEPSETPQLKGEAEISAMDMASLQAGDSQPGRIYLYSQTRRRTSCWLEYLNEPHAADAVTTLTTAELRLQQRSMIFWQDGLLKNERHPHYHSLLNS